MIKERLEAQKIKDELLYMIKDHVIHNVPLSKRTLLNSLVGVGFTYRIFEEDREILAIEGSTVAVRIDFIYINENDIKLVCMHAFKSFFIRYSKLKHLYYRKFNCHNKEL